MKRVALGALWITTIAATWLIVRGATTDADERTSMADTSRVERATAVPRLPSPREPRPAVAADDSAFQQARATLERDIADGRWSAADRDRLNAAMLRLQGHEARELLSILFPKLNSGVVKSELDGPI